MVGLPVKESKMKYFVSYFEKVNVGFGFGNCFITTDDPIASPERLEEVTSAIAEGSDREIIILSFIEVPVSHPE